MPVRALKNQYRGINAHLQSYLQADGDWENFHFNHISDLNRTLLDVLDPLGYTASSQQSLQIRLDTNAPRRPESDVTIYDPDFVRASLPRQSLSPQVMEKPLITHLGITEEETTYYKAVAIHRADQKAGIPVAWLELLSPSNKPGGRGYRQYIEKRHAILEQGLVFVEIDYLHASPSVSDAVISYARKGRPLDEAYPYLISVSVPRPNLAQGKTYLHQFKVDDPMLPITIPLSASDVIDFDFSVPYNRTFQEIHLWKQVDYAQLPPNFDQYSPADQLRILKRILTVIDAAQQGQDLEAAAPLPIAYTDISLEEALAKLNSISAKQ